MLPTREEAINSERLMRIICIGAGPSGLCFAYKLQRSFRQFSFTIYEKNADVSGTWFENTYPGCACDIPAHNYTYTFEPKHDWSNTYAFASEIKQYYHDFSQKYDLNKYIRTLHKVTNAQWLEQEGEWKVRVEDLTLRCSLEVKCDILINAGGYLNHWEWPPIPGIEGFKGALMHSANWNSEVELRDRKVALIGNGSSAVQILPAIQPLAEELINFVRSPNWILPDVGEKQRAYTLEEIDEFDRDPSSLTSKRKATEASLNSYFEVYLQNSPLQVETRSKMIDFMKFSLRNEELEKAMIPSFSVGCRRLTPGSAYLEALGKANVRVVHQKIIEVTKNGCRWENGGESLFDVLICATGFDTSYRPRYPIIGLDNVNLQDAWASKPTSYLGIAATGFPNFFLLLGPHSPIGNGPLLRALEAQIDHILMLLDRWQTENIYFMSPKADAVEDFMAHTAEFMSQTVWMESCRSGYKNHRAHGQVPTLWPGSSLHCVEALASTRADDWDIRYKGNRFAWLGNGLSQTELDETSDLAYYVKDHDDSPYLSRGRRREVLTGSGKQKPRKLHEVYRPT
ncbi:MAG: hypothetical protein ASARMPREDX12_000998 [Alectoria sarmentosa]|nr:MAG: hypothetical protein ASARMPREDX12_000998 [Alectoria sarmentosa]